MRLRNTNEYAAAKHTDTHAANGANPVVIDSVFYKEAYRQYQNSDTDFIHQVLADEFLQVGMALKKG
jgi:hypothetical protein